MVLRPPKANVIVSDTIARLPHEQVLVSVKAVGLNFRDVLNVLGMYPGDPGDPGQDCAGVIAAVGSAVAGHHRCRIFICILRFNVFTKEAITGIVRHPDVGNQLILRGNKTVCIFDSLFIGSPNVHLNRSSVQQETCEDFLDMLPLPSDLGP